MLSIHPLQTDFSAIWWILKLKNIYIYEKNIYTPYIYIFVPVSGAKKWEKTLPPLAEKCKFKCLEEQDHVVVGWDNGLLPRLSSTPFQPLIFLHTKRRISSHVYKMSPPWMQRNIYSSFCNECKNQGGRTLLTLSTAGNFIFLSSGSFWMWVEK